MIKLKPIGDRVLVKLIENKETMQDGLYIPDTSHKEATQFATIWAIGSGRREDGSLIEFQLEIGSSVIINKYSITEVKTEEGKFALVRYDDILAVIE